MRKLKKKKGWNGMVVTENDFWRMGHEGKGKLIFKKEKKKKESIWWCQELAGGVMGRHYFVGTDLVLQDEESSGDGWQ